tara:strand:- start:109 stop:378 length:270 start_codon:yes stop_codon:yes gene_type:complete
MAKRKDGQLKYDVDKGVRQKIDDILRQCASIFANLGMKNKYDLGTREAARAEERRLIDKIKDIDEDFYHDCLYIPRSEEKNEKTTEQES